MHYTALFTNLFEITCGIRVSTSAIGFHTDLKSSKGFYAGVKGFYSYQVVDGSALVMKPKKMTITSPYFSDSDPTEYRLDLKTADLGTHGIWKNVILPPVTLQIIPDARYKSSICYAHADPHMRTSDGRLYEQNNFGGLFILYRHENGIEIQMRTTSCGNDRAYCVCAVAIRAGGDVFLINLCGSLRFIGMTSCKDGGVLIVQKNNEFKYQVQTNIGTLIMISIMTVYSPLMNIDIYMAPKDFNKIKGLCGTFDGNASNDFHNRNGAPVSLKTFLNAWQVNNTLDINLLEPSCTIDVGTWEGNGQPLYCTCNCYGGSNDDCDYPEKTATCSPTQYVNCTVSLSKTSDMCKDYEEMCNKDAVKKRSSSYIEPEGEMKRRAALAELPHIYNVKRRRHTGVITVEMAKTECTNNILTDTYKKNVNVLSGFNISQAIEECTRDVYSAQDEEWIAAYRLATDIAIAVGYKRNADYTISHLDELKEFRMQSCPYNCNRKGVCQENGTCKCNGSYFGPDCGKDKTKGQVIEDIEGGGLCDQRYGSECRCFSVQVEALAEPFQCRMVRQKKMLSGVTRVTGTDITEGRYRNLFNGNCCFATDRRNNSDYTEKGALHYVYDISISNDGQNFGPSTRVYVYDSLCLKANAVSDGNVSFTIRADTCLIDGSCYEQNIMDIRNICYKCDPRKTQYNWTNGCATPTNDEDGTSVAMISAVVTGTFVFTSVFIALIVCARKGLWKPPSCISQIKNFNQKQS